MLMPTLAARMTMPVVSIGSRLSRWAGQRMMARGATAGSSMLLGVATGLVWAPCAGPVLGLILTGATLRGPSVGTSLLLLTYGLGAATSLAAGLLFGRRLLALVRQSAPSEGWPSTHLRDRVLRRRRPRVCFHVRIVHRIQCS
jgi:cytochrome c biogenesis protein CcdA